MDDYCGERDCGKEDLRAPVVSCCHAPPILEPVEHDLDTVAAFMASLVVLKGFLALFPTWDAGSDLFVFQRFSELASVIASIFEQPFAFWQTSQQVGTHGPALWPTGAGATFRCGAAGADARPGCDNWPALASAHLLDGASKRLIRAHNGGTCSEDSL